MEIAALRGRGWSVSAIARHTGRDRKTIRTCLKGQAKQRGRAPSVLEPFREYLVARFADDPHVLGTVLFRELVGLIIDWSLVRVQAGPLTCLPLDIATPIDNSDCYVTCFSAISPR
jgi:hypothetical protein